MATIAFNNDTASLTTPARRWWQRILPAFLWRDAPPELEEERHRMPLASYALTVLQSIAVVLALGHSEIPLLFAPDWSIRLLMSGALFVLIASVVIADYAAIKSMERLPVLARNASTALLIEHLAYIAFLLLIELTTFAVVLAALDRDPHALITNSASIIPNDGPLFYAQIVLRAGLVAWTAVQLYATSLPFPVQWSTLDRKAMRLLGGLAQTTLENLQLQRTDIASIFNAVAAVSRPSLGERHWYSAWLYDAKAARMEMERSHQREVITALERLSHNSEAEHAAAIAALRGDMERQQHVLIATHEQEMTRLQDALSRAQEDYDTASIEANRHIKETVKDILLHLLAKGEAPAILMDIAPDVADLLPAIISPRGGKRGGKATAISSDSLDIDRLKGTANELRILVQRLGIEEANKPDKARGVWVKSTDIPAISDGHISGQEATMLARSLGNGARDGRAYIAPMEALIPHLAERNKLHNTLIAWQHARTKKADITDDSDAHGNEQEAPRLLAMRSMV